MLMLSQVFNVKNIPINFNYISIAWDQFQERGASDNETFHADRC